MAAAARLETARGGLESPDGLVTRPGEVAQGCIVARGHIPRRERTGAPASRQLHGIASSGFHAVTRVVRQQRGGHDPVLPSCVGQVALALVPTGPCCLDQDERLGRGVARADAVSAVP
jgi:hypothetical protein